MTALSNNFSEGPKFHNRISFGQRETKWDNSRRVVVIIILLLFFDCCYFIQFEIWNKRYKKKLQFCSIIILSKTHFICEFMNIIWFIYLSSMYIYVCSMLLYEGIYEWVYIYLKMKWYVNMPYFLFFSFFSISFAFFMLLWHAYKNINEDMIWKYIYI